MNTTIKTIIISVVASAVVALLMVVGLATKNNVGTSVENDQKWFSSGIKIGPRTDASGITQMLINNKSWYPGAIASTSQATTTLAVTGASTGNVCLASLTTLTDSRLELNCSVIASNTASVQLVNQSPVSITSATGTLSVKVIQ